MLVLLWLALFLLGLCALVVMPLLLGNEFYREYSGARVVTCPENERQVSVTLDAAHAAVTRLAGRASIRLTGCSRWPERASCGRECLSQARAAEAYRDQEMSPKVKPIHHIPIFLAAFVAWLIGAVWHSHYLFRAQWMDAAGLNRSEVHQLVWQLTPHLLTFAIPLLFAYGVASALAWLETTGPLRGVLLAVSFWAILVGIALSIVDMGQISRDLLKLEAGYTFIAAVVIGAIVGGTGGKRFHEQWAPQ